MYIPHACNSRDANINSELIKSCMLFLTGHIVCLPPYLLFLYWHIFLLVQLDFPTAFYIIKHSIVLGRGWVRFPNSGSSPL